MKHGSLFSGIGGAELAAQWAGWENVFHCEINPFGRKVLDYYWPKAKSYADIKQTNFTIWRNRIDVLSGGFPCQPFSTAGKRKGTEDDRHLWPEMLRAIREIQPRYVVGENVRGFTNWNGGLVFDQVLSDLENEGYEVAPFLLPACGVNAPHRRDRIWIVAYTNNKRRSTGFGEIQKENGEIPKWDKNSKSGNASNGDVTDADNERLQGFLHESIETRQSIPEKRLPFNSINSWGNNWYNFPTQPPVRGRNDGLSTELDGITFSKWRNESIKAYGNAWVPQVAYEIFKVINQIESQINVA